MVFWRCVFCVVFIVICVCVDLGLSDFVSEEERLRAAVLSGYNVDVRPYHKTHILLTGYLMSLNHLDIAQQSMSANVMFHLNWQDERLQWNATEYGGLTSLVIDTERIWTPPVVIQNAAENVGIIGGKYRDATPVRVRSEGMVDWFPVTEVTTSCEMLIVHYPFDTQVCDVNLVGWTYPLSEMNITAGGMNIEALFSTHGEFDLVSSSSFSTKQGGPAEDNIYMKLHLQLSWRRKWQFYGQNILMPIVLNSILMNGVFLLPIESGDKMSYCLTVLLSYVVFLTWVTENLPPISTDTSVLQIYLAIVLCLGCLATLLTTWVLHMYHIPANQPVSACYLKLANTLLALSYRRTHCATTTTKNTKAQDEVDTEPIRHMKITKVRPSSARSVVVESQKPHHLRELFHVQDSAHRLNDGNDGGDNREITYAYTWQELAVLMDHFFFWVFGVLLVILTATVLSMLYANY